MMETIRESKRQKKEQRASVKAVRTAPNVVSHGIILISSIIPSIVAGRKRYENRDFRIKPGYYALYGSKHKNDCKKRFLEEHPEENTEDLMEKIKQVEGKIVGVIEVQKSWEKGVDEDYPVDPYAQGKFTHLIAFTPLKETDYISDAYKKGQVTYMKLDSDVSDKLTKLISKEE